MSAAGGVPAWQRRSAHVRGAAMPDWSMPTISRTVPRVGTRLGRDSMPIRVRGGAVAALLITLAAGSAAAQGGPDVFGDRWQVGGLVYVSPSFEGSKSYEAIAFPFVAPAGIGTEGVIQIKGADDVRLRVFQSGGFEAGPLAGYRFGRDGEDVSNVLVGDVDGG